MIRDLGSSMGWTKACVWPVVGALALLSSACSEAAPSEPVAGSLSSELSTTTARTLGFESLGDWSALLPNAHLTLSSVHTQGQSSLAIKGGGWMQVYSRKLDGSGPFPAVLGFDIASPDKPIDKAWWGTVALLVDAPESGVLPVLLGLHDLRALGAGFHRVEFAVPPALQRHLGGSYKDLRLSIVVNAPLRENAAYLLDDFRFGGSAVPTCMPQDDQNPCTDDLCVGNVPSHVARAAGTNCDSNDNVCDGTALCDATGSCQAQVAPVLDDHNVCTVDTCDAHGGVSHLPVADGAACDDGDSCTLADACNAGTCSSGTPKVCAPVDACHDAGVCQQATGECSTTPKIPGCGDGQGSGGSAASGGSEATGGSSATGGSGGSSATGGSSASGGSEPSGGSSATGGSSASGGSGQLPEEPLAFLSLPNDFQPPQVPPSAVLGSVELLDPNQVLPANVSMSAASDEDGAAIANDVAGVSLEPSGPLAGVAYLKLPVSANGLPALWTKTAASARYRLQSLGRVVGSYAYFPIQHFSLQRMSLQQTPSTDARVLPVPLPDQYGGLAPQNTDYNGPDYTWPWWASGRNAASVSFNGVASLTSLLADQSIVDPFPAGAGSRDGSVLVDDLDGFVKGSSGSFALDDICIVGADLLPRSARVSAEGKTVSWVVLGPDSVNHLCRATLASATVEQCALPAAVTDLGLSSIPGASLAEDGGWLAFETSAALSPEDTNGVLDVYVASLANQPNCAVELAARDDAGSPLALGSTLKGAARGLSAHGRFVGFSSTEGLDLEVRVLFVRDRKLAKTRRAGTLPSAEPQFDDPASWYRNDAWSLSDSGRILAFRSAPTFDISDQLLPDYSLTDNGLVTNVVDGGQSEVWSHHVDYARGANEDCGAYGGRAFDPNGTARYCESLRGPYGLSLSGDGQTVVFLADDGGYNFRAQDFPEPERYLKQHVVVPTGPAPQVTFPVGVSELQPFELVVGQAELATARTLFVSGPDGDYYEMPLSYGADGLAHVPFANGVAGGGYSVGVLVEAEADLATVEVRPAGGFNIGSIIPQGVLASAPLEYVETPLALTNLATFEPGAKVELYRTDTSPNALVDAWRLPFAAQANVVVSRQPEGEYELRTSVRVLGKDRLRLTQSLSVKLGFEFLGAGSHPSLSDDGRLVAFCSGGHVTIHERPTRRSTTWTEPCDDVRITPSGEHLIVSASDSDTSFIRIFELGSATKLFEYSYQQAGDRLTTHLGDWPFSADERYLAFEVQFSRGVSPVLVRNLAFVVDTTNGQAGNTFGTAPSLSADGSQLLFGRGFLSCDADSCDVPRPMRVPTSFMLANCGGAGCNYLDPLFPLPGRLCNLGSQCFNDPVLPLPETPAPIGQTANPDEITIEASTRDGDFVYYHSPPDETAAWQLWQNGHANTYATLAAPLGNSQLSSPSAALIGNGAWLAAKTFDVPSVKRFQQPGAPGVDVVTLPAGSAGALAQLRVTPDQRLLAFTANTPIGLQDAAGQTPTSVPAPPPPLSSGVFLVRANPIP